MNSNAVIKDDEGSIEQTIFASFSLLQEAQDIVQNKTEKYFFGENGENVLPENQILEWVADRAIDEYKIGYMATELILKYGHEMEPWLVSALGKQVQEETKHYQLLINILPKELQKQVRQRMMTFPSIMKKNIRWKSLISTTKNNDFCMAFFELSLVHEGFANAAIEPVTKLPYENISRVYKIIKKDEKSHYSIGKKYVVRSCRTQYSANQIMSIAINTKERANNCAGYDW